MIGLLSAEQWPETEALAQKFEILPHKTAVYARQRSDEIDLGACLKRLPQLILIDELSHLNADDSRHAKRYQDIEELLKYAEDLTVIPSFPLAPVSYSAGGKLRLGECILWTVETIRLGNNASMGCKMVHTDAENYEGIYFLSDEEVLDAASRYRRWWETRKYPRTMWTIDPCYDEPLCGSGYMWW